MGKVMSRESMERYSKGVGSCGKMAEAEMRASLKEYLREHPDAGVEDLRNFCIRRIGEIGGFYGGAAQQLAETMLAEVSELNGYAAPRLDGYVYAPEMERVDGDVRYLMEKWKDGDEQGFIDSVCATARANAEFGANATMAHAAAKQAERNGKKGGKRKEARGGGRKQASALRFARVPMGGRETCDFCIMLASRGFVYHTKETAGELKHYHANCACRIVPGFEGDRVDGYDPDYYYDVWKHPEDHPEVGEARNARRRELYREKHPRRFQDSTECDLDYIGGKDHKKKIRQAFAEDLPGDAVDDIGRILRHRSGTEFEDLYAYDITTGERLGSKVNSKIAKAVYPNAKMKAKMQQARELGHEIAVVHNHPGSTAPSFSDIEALVTSGSKFGCIACHDGSMIRYEIVSEPAGGYSLDEKTYNRICQTCERKGYFEAMEMKLGVRIVRY